MKNSLFIGSALGLCCLSTSLFATVSGQVENVSGVAYTPTAIVVEDAIVVFYQLKSNLDQVVFSVGKLNAEGNLDWGSTSYIVDTDVIQSASIAPAPALLDGKLYLFGRSADKKLIYNAVDSLQNLIDGVWMFESPELHYHGVPTELDANLPYISALEYAHGDLSTPDQNKERRILLAYYSKNSNEHFSSSTCYAIYTGQLLCSGGPHVYEYGSTKFNGAPHLVNSYFYSFENAFPEMYIRNTAGTMTVNSFNPQNGYGTDYTWWGNSNYDVPQDAMHASQSPIGSVQTRNSDGDYLTQLYFRNAGNNDLHKTSESLTNSAYDWNKAQDLYLDTIDHQGVSAVVYNDRAYMFYVQNGSNEADVSF